MGGVCVLRAIKICQFNYATIPTHQPQPPNHTHLHVTVSVGFSYATSEEDNEAFGDEKAAADNYLVSQCFD